MTEDRVTSYFLPFGKYLLLSGLAALFVLAPSLSDDSFQSLRIGQMSSISNIVMVLMIVAAVFGYVAGDFVRLSRIDVLLLGCFLWVAGSRLLGGANAPFSLRYIELVILAVLYVILRLNRKGFLILFFCCVFGCALQSIHGLLQLYGLVGSNHSSFKITGNFFNPGPFGGFVAVGLCLSIGLAIWCRKREDFNTVGGTAVKILMKGLPLIGIVLGLMVMPATGSRAGWLAFIAASCYLTWRLGVLQLCFERFPRLKKMRGLLVISALVVVATGGSSLYFIKKPSSDGRLLIWKVTKNIIAKYPLFGRGFDTFKSEYMQSQIGYLKANPHTENVDVADSVKYSFNIFLLYLSENGIIFLILVILTMVCIFTPTSEPLEVVIKACMLCLIVFACFSYPEQVFSIKLYGVLFLAFLADREETVVERKVGQKCGRLLALLVRCLLLLGAVLFIGEKRKLGYYYEQLDLATEYSDIGQYERSLPLFSGCYAPFKNDGYFLLEYGKALSSSGHSEMSARVLRRAELFWDNYVVQLTLADVYDRSNNMALAKKCYIRASEMIPSRIYPKYLLAKLYRRNKDSQAAINLAAEILNQKIKVESRAVDEIREEMRAMLSELRNER